MMFCRLGLSFALTRLFPFIGFQTIIEQRSLEDLPCLGKTIELSDLVTMTCFSRIATTISGNSDVPGFISYKQSQNTTTHLFGMLRQTKLLSSLYPSDLQK